MTLRLLCDENSGDLGLYERLSNDSRFSVERVVDIAPLGPRARDTEIWRYAVSNDYLVLTNGRDFVDGNADPGEGTYPGVIMRSGTNWDRIFEALREIESHYSQSQVVAMGAELWVPGEWV
jgi:predicted nuclease of predicted toxin-antitoxin system